MRYSTTGEHYLETSFISDIAHQLLLTIINCVVRDLNADWLTAMVYQTVYYRYDKTFIFTALIMLVTVYNSNTAPQGFVIYGQYTKAKCFVQALRIASCIRTALSCVILAIYDTFSGLIA